MDYFWKNCIELLNLKSISNWYEYRFKKKKQKIILKKAFLSWWIMQFLEKLLKMWENIEINKNKWKNRNK